MTTIAATLDAERRRIAEDLHNRIGPNLATIGLNLHLIEEHLKVSAAATRDAELLQVLEESQELLTQTIAAIRELSGELRPARLEYAGLEAALIDFTQQYRRRTGVHVRVTMQLATPQDGTPRTAPGTAAPPRLNPTLEWLLYRVIREALANCARHASAGHVHVDLRREGPMVQLQISDDGVGFDPDAIGLAPAAPGLGLLEMRERVEQAHGRFTVRSQPGHGTHILATVPLSYGRALPEPAANATPAP